MKYINESKAKKNTNYAFYNSIIDTILERNFVGKKWNHLKNDNWKIVILAW